MSTPLVSIITPTWKRPQLLTERCIPSVQAQAYPAVEHVIVVDGPDPELEALLERERPQWTRHPVVTDFLPEHAPGVVGGRTAARRRGLEIASGDIIGYIDDDDALRGAHVGLLAPEIAAGHDLAFSDMARHGKHEDIVGGDQPGYGRVGTPQVLHSRKLLEIANWGEVSDSEDWDLFGQWFGHGISWTHLPVVTVDAWPEEWREGWQGGAPTWLGSW